MKRFALILAVLALIGLCGCKGSIDIDRNSSEPIITQ